MLRISASLCKIQISSVVIRHGEQNKIDLPFDNHLCDHELPVLALSKGPDVRSQFGNDFLPLLLVGVFESALDNTDTVMLEDKVAHSAIDNLEQLGYESLALLRRHMRLSP